MTDYSKEGIARDFLAIDSFDNPRALLQQLLGIGATNSVTEEG